ncbi:MAG: hypothetical protein RIG84_17365 [Roseovarius sp.]
MIRTAFLFLLLAIWALAPALSPQAAAFAMTNGESDDDRDDDDDQDPDAKLPAAPGAAVREDAEEEARAGEALGAEAPAPRKRALTRNVARLNLVDSLRESATSTASTSSAATSTGGGLQARVPARDAALRQSAAAHDAAAAKVDKAFRKRFQKNVERAALIDAVSAVTDISAGSSAEPVGGLPGEFAQDLLRLAALRQPGGPVGLSEVRQHFSPERGVDYDALTDDNAKIAFETGLPNRLRALDEAIALATEAMRGLPNDKSGTKRATVLNAYIAAATAHRDDLVSAMRDTIEYYPGSLAEPHTPSVGAIAALPVVGSGDNADLRGLDYNFTTGVASVPAEGRRGNTLFKPEPAPGKALQSKGLDKLGVDTSGETPMRASFRAKATAIVGEALGLSDLVVRTELASLNGRNGVFGILMERSGGIAPVQDGWAVAEDGERNPTVALLVQAEAAVTQATAERDAARRDADARSVPRSRQAVNFSADSSESSQDRLNRAEAALQEAQRNLLTAQGNARRRISNDNAGDGTEGWEIRQSVRMLSDAVMASPEFRQALVNAELLDHLCGQVDRHMGNILVTVVDGPNGPRVTRVTLIDNDLSFGIGDYQHNEQNPWGELTPLPRVVDRDMKQRLLELNGDELARKLTGLLSPEEIDALKARLKLIKKHLRQRSTKTASLDGAKASLSWADPQGATGTGAAPHAALLFANADGRVKSKRDGRTSYFGQIMAAPPPSGPQDDESSTEENDS